MTIQTLVVSLVQEKLCGEDCNLKVSFYDKAGFSVVSITSVKLGESPHARTVYR